MSSGPLTPDEIEADRAATPGCRPDLIHLNHAGSSLPPQVVLDTQLDHLRLEATIGGYEAAAATVDERAAVYGSIARLIGADRSEIARCEHATAAWNAAFWSIPMEPGRRILVHDHEYGANAIAFLHAAATRGVAVERIASDEHGQVSVDALADSLGDGGDVALVSLTWVPTNSGLVNPAGAVGRLARVAGVPYLVDACQAVGQLGIDVDEIGCDFLSATGRKYLRGPRGTGFLYARSSILDRVTPSQPDHDGAVWAAADQYEFATGAKRYEHWEHSPAGWLALGAAVDHALAFGIDRIEPTIAARAETLRGMLRDIGFTVYDEGVDRCGIVTAASDLHSALDLQRMLGEQGINVSTTGIGSSRWDVERRDLPPLLRLSVHYTTTDDELARTVKVLAGA
ncbi:MAG: aminotransferase class V-fold PLP-dependent enzyme [Ilumatobacteraceae bacterium]